MRRACLPLLLLAAALATAPAMAMAKVLAEGKPSPGKTRASHRAVTSY